MPGSTPLPAILAEVAFTTGPGSTSPVWENVTEFLRAATIQREAPLLERASPGNATLVLDNSSRIFEPGYAGSPYYPNVKSMRRVRLRAIYPQNLVQPVDNSDFELGATTGWTTSVTGGTLSVSNPANFGAYSLLAVSDASGSNQAKITSQSIPVQSGSSYVLSAAFYKVSGAVSVKAHLRAVFYASNGSLISTVYPAPTAAQPGFSTGALNGADVATGGFFRYGGELQAPAAAASMKIEILPFYQTGGVVQVRVDSVMLTAGQSGIPWQQGVLYDLFNGYVEMGGWKLDWKQRASYVSVSCVDGFELLNNKKLAAYYPQAMSGARIVAILDAAGWPAGASYRSLAAGASEIQELTLEDEEGLGHILDVADSELGRFFIDGAGRAVFLDRRSQPPVSAGTFADNPAPGEYLYIDLKPSQSTVWNEIRTTPAGIGITAMLASDSTSRTDYGDRTLARQPLLTTDVEAQAQSDYLLSRYKAEQIEWEALTLEPKRTDVSDVWPLALGLDIGARIVTKKTPPGFAGSPIAVDSVIERVGHEWASQDGRMTWRTSWGLSPSDPNSYWVLGTSALDSGTRLGY